MELGEHTRKAIAHFAMWLTHALDGQGFRIFFVHRPRLTRPTERMEFTVAPGLRALPCRDWDVLGTETRGWSSSSSYTQQPIAVFGQGDSRSWQPGWQFQMALQGLTPDRPFATPLHMGGLGGLTETTGPWVT